MIPVCLVTGFLGSGKTTLLRLLAGRLRGRCVVFLVNEFSAHDVDGGLVAKDADAVVTVTGGSIFCRCLVTEFIARLGQIPKQWPAVEGVIVEASGMANPAKLPEMLAETGLNRIYSPGRIIALVDPGSFPKLFDLLPNIRAQVEMADTVLINKTDCYAETAIVHAERLVRKLRPDAEIHRCIDANVPLDPFRPSGDQCASASETDTSRDPRYRSFEMDLNGPACPRQLKRVLERHGKHIYRAKGYIHHGKDVYHVDFSASGFTCKPAGTDIKPGMTLILNGAAPPDLEARIQRESFESL